MTHSPSSAQSGAHEDAEREAFKPVGRCECAFSQDECEVCEANREAYREWQMENGTSDDKFAPHRLKVAEECCERLMSACTDAGCPDGVPMDDWIRDVVARAAASVQATGQAVAEVYDTISCYQCKGCGDNDAAPGYCVRCGGSGIEPTPSPDASEAGGRVTVLAELLFALTERQKGNVIRSEDEYIDRARALLREAGSGK